MAKLVSKTSEVKEHAEYSASGSDRWLNCPASHNLIPQAPPQRESEYAAEGTKAHACFEFLLKNRASLKSALVAARKSWDEEMVEHGEAAVRWVLARYQEHPGAEILCETKVDSSPFTCTGQFGTLDAAVVQEFGRLIVCDYKYGAGVGVDPAYDGEANSQMAYYALAISFAYHHNFTEVELVVIQPRAWHHTGETIRTHVMSMDELLGWKKRFHDGVCETNNPKAKFAAGRWCKFCPAAVICPELRDESLKRAQVVFNDGVVESLPAIVQGIAIPNLGTILRGCDELETWIGKVRDHAFHVLNTGGEIEGYKLVDKKSPRKWKEPDATAEKARKLFGDEAFTAPKLLSPAQLEKIGASAKKFTVDNSSSESSGVTLVDASDPRPAVNAIEKAFGEPPKKVKSK